MLKPKVPLTEGQWESFKDARKEMLLTHVVLFASPFVLWLAVSDVLRPLPVIGVPLTVLSVVGLIGGFLFGGSVLERYREFRAGNFSYTG